LSRRLSRAESVRALEELGAVAIVRLDDAARLRSVVEALDEGEVRAVEITLTMPGALDALAGLTSALGDRLVLGAGTVLDAETARLAILAGARFVVAPTFRPTVVETCHRYDVVAIPGAFTATEILTAWEQGADVVKVFPARALGPSYFREILGPLPQVRLLATGGVTTENAGEFLAAGAIAVGVGGALVERDVVARGDVARITAQARRLTNAVRSARERS
jgi:2-dehydro-3-deoxyphosphogluconate aldolase/(4S)-4-hydroxy-2-oxoglutarate aldolase